MTPAEKQNTLYDQTCRDLDRYDISERHKHAVIDLLENYVGCQLISPWELQLVDGRIGILWKLEHGMVSVLFGPGDDWEWHAESNCDLKEDYTYSKKLDYVGKHTYTITGNDGITTVHYCLPSDVDKILSQGLREEFSKDFSPLKQWEYKVEWVTSKYDGMLGGYCRYKNRLHYFYLVEETPLERHRMYAIYHLTTWQRITAWTRHLRWYISFGNKLLWKLNWWSVRKALGIKNNYKIKPPEELYGPAVAFFTDRKS